MGMKFTNFATSTLASGILAGATSLSVFAGDGAKFPVLGAGDYFYAVLENLAGAREIIKVTARTGDSFGTIVRAQDGTSALAWNAGDKVELRLVNLGLVELTASEIHDATNKTTPVDADELGIWDSVSLALRKVTWANLKATLKTYFDTLYSVASTNPYGFNKSDSTTPAFTKTGAGTLSVKAGTSAVVAGVLNSWAADTAITMPTLVAGTDYAIYTCTDGSIRADSSFTAPTGYTTANSRKIGGFHYGLVAAGTTVAGGSFATTGNGMIWTQGDVDNIAGINMWSIWDLKFRPACSDPRGMALVNGRTWVDIYLCSTDTAANGTSKAGSNIASGTVLPKIPAAFGGNGTTTYPTLNWWVANELARANQKRMMWEHEFVDAAFGVTENQSIDATASTYPTTQRNAGYTSKYGIEQASGHHWTWGQDSSAYQDVTGADSYKTVTGNTGAAGSERGSIYTFGTYGLVRVLLGGTRANGAISGSRCSFWVYYPWLSAWSFGLRAACDHLQLA